MEFLFKVAFSSLFNPKNLDTTMFLHKFVVI